MSTAAGPRKNPLIAAIDVSDQFIVARLVDGRTISVPLSWSWRLARATRAQRQRYEIIGGGEGVHWPDIDEDISVDGMLNGRPAPGSQRSEPAV